MYTLDVDRQMTDEKVKLLSGVTGILVELMGSMLTWMYRDIEVESEMMAVGFVPPRGDIVKVTDPDGIVRWWEVESIVDTDVICDIEEKGSRIVFTLAYASSHSHIRHKFANFQRLNDYIAT